MEQTAEDDESFSELERRYLITLILTEAIDSQERIEELDSIAVRIDDGDEEAEEQYSKFEQDILSKFGSKYDTGKLSPLPWEDETLAGINRRMELCYFLNRLHEDQEGIGHMEQLSRETRSMFIEDPSLAVRRADERLAAQEESLISLYLDDDETENLEAP